MRQAVGHHRLHRPEHGGPTDAKRLGGLLPTEPLGPPRQEYLQYTDEKFPGFLYGIPCPFTVRESHIYAINHDSKIAQQFLMTGLFKVFMNILSFFYQHVTFLFYFFYYSIELSFVLGTRDNFKPTLLCKIFCFLQFPGIAQFIDLREQRGNLLGLSQ